MRSHRKVIIGWVSAIAALDVMGGFAMWFAPVEQVGAQNGDQVSTPTPTPTLEPDEEDDVAEYWIGLRNVRARVVVPINTWEDDADSIVSYKIERSHTSVDGEQSVHQLLVSEWVPEEVGPNVIYYDGNVANGMSYEYRIRPRTVVDGITQFLDSDDFYEEGEMQDLSWGYGNAAGAVLHITPTSRVGLDELEVRIDRRSSLSHVKGIRSDTYYPATPYLDVETNTLRIEDDTAIPGRYYTYEVELWENIEGEQSKVATVPAIVLLAGEVEPGAPQDVNVSQMESGGAIVSWSEGQFPGQVAQYEILRRSISSLGEGTFEVVGATRELFFEDHNAQEEMAYEYKVRPVSVHATAIEGDESDIVSYPLLMCDTLVDKGQRVTELHIEVDMLAINQNNEFNFNVLDTWAYAATDDVTVERCHTLPPYHVALNRQLTYKKVIDDDRCPVAGESCAVELTDAEMATDRVFLRWDDYGFGRHTWLHGYDISPIHLANGEYQFRYQVCAVVDDSLCSPWRDADTLSITSGIAP